MPPTTPTLPSPFEDRRDYYRITVVLPVSIQAETDTTEGEFREKAVNISGGGIGITVNVLYSPSQILSLTLHFPDRVIFKASIEILRLDPIAYPAHTYRLHARFVRMTVQNRELLIRYIMGFQRDHLERHYSA